MSKENMLIRGFIKNADGEVLWGFIDTKQQWVVLPIYEDIDNEFDNENYCRAKQNGFWGFIDKNGDWLIEPTYDSVYLFSNDNFCCASQNSKYGFIDRKGRWFDSFVPFDDKNFGAVEINKKWGFINRESEWIINPNFSYVGNFDSHDYCIVATTYGSEGPDHNFMIVNSRDKYGFINREGKFLIEPIFERLGTFDTNGFCSAMINDKWGFLGRNGKWLIDPVFDNIREFDKDGFCPALINNEWGIIDRKGKWIVLPEYEALSIFNSEHGFYKATLKDMWGIINQQGEWVINPIFDNEVDYDNEGTFFGTNFKEKRSCDIPFNNNELTREIDKSLFEENIVPENSMINFTLKNQLGQGGWSTVFLAENNQSKTDVAIKILNTEFINNEDIKNLFLSEVNYSLKMRNPNIVEVTDLIKENDTIAYVMEYIEGIDLKNFLNNHGKLSDKEIISWFTQMLDSVEYVHEHNLVHCDIKPSHFMLSISGVVKLLDFGIAKSLNSIIPKNTILGTPLYMSPEHVKGYNEITSQSDIYSLGVVLWQMVTGEKIYDTNNMDDFEIQSKIVYEALPLTGTKWDKLIQQCTQKEISVRFKTIKEVKNILITDVINLIVKE